MREFGDAKNTAEAAIGRQYHRVKWRTMIPMEIDKRIAGFEALDRAYTDGMSWQ